MKYITVPAVVTLVDPVTEKPIPKAKPQRFDHFLNANILTDKKWGADMDTIFQKQKVKKLFRNCKEGDVIAVEDEDCKLLVDVVKSPTNGYDAVITDQFTSYLAALSDPQEDHPSGVNVPESDDPSN